MSAENEFDIAIVGMSGRFPGAATLDKFWQNLAQGVDSISHFSDQELLAAGVPPAWLEDPHYVKAAPILDAPGDFDAQFFGFSPAEARTMDPQHRILLELAHEALEDAGYDSEVFAGRIGVFTGAALNTYFLNRELSGRLAQDYIPTLIGADKDFLSTRIAYKLNLKGPSITIQTACSTSMVAVHLARQSLLSKETDMVLAGGISVRVPHRAGYFYDGGGVVSPDGVVRSFDAQANGTVFGSGGGVLILKRLADAVADGDTIHAVIKGSAVNNDGSEKAGYTAPSVNGQADAVIEALANADVSADTISYVEAHGSGTPVGDPVEVSALTKAFRAFTQRSGFCAIGSVKTNVGHLDAAAAVTGIIKTVLALRHGKIPPSLHFDEANPQIDFSETPFYVNNQLRDWTSRGPRRAGVMSTGMGGTNAYVVLEEAPESQRAVGSQGSHLLVLSARTQEALDQATHRLHEFLTRDDSVDLGDVAYTLQVGRKAFPFRRYTVCSRREDAITALGVSDAKQVFSGRVDDSAQRPLVLLLPGVGDHYVGMGHELYERSSIFRDEVDRCAEILKPHLGIDIRKILYPDNGKWKDEGGQKGIDFKKLVGRKGEQSEDPDTNNLNKTLYAQPAVFTIEYSLARLWKSLGITPDAIVGHSMGEYVAACLAGVLTLENALRLIAVRARLVDPLPRGGMLAVMQSERELLPLLPPELSIALINGPSLCVVAGPQAYVDQFESNLRAKEVGCRRVQNAHAFHSQMMDPVVKAFEDEVRKVQLKSPKIPFISNVTGTWITRTEATSPEYWAMHLNHPARFSDALHQLWTIKDAMLLEAGPGRTLSVLAMQHPGRKTSVSPLTVSSLRHSYENESDVNFLWHAIGKLWLSGAAITWDNIERAERRRISLPTYPFQRQNYWVADSSLASSSDRRTQGTVASGLDDWFYAPTWERTTSLDNAPEVAGLQSAYWLIIANRSGEGGRLRAQLENHLATAGLVRLGKRFASKGDVFELDPESPEDYLKLFRELKARAPRGLNIVHLGCFTQEDKPANSVSAVSAQSVGFYSLMYMAQAVAELDLSIPIKIGVVSNRLHQVTGDENVDPAFATVLGPCGVIPKEFENINCFNIDLPENHSADQLSGDVFRAVISEFADQSRSRVIAYRGRYRWERRYKRVQIPKTPLLRARNQAADLGSLKRGGVYLITGGTGGIGLAIAKYLAEMCQARLVLTKRSQFPEKAKWRELRNSADAPDSTRRTIEKLLEIEEAGAEVEVVVADASDVEQTSSAIDFIVRRFGRVDGVIHAAGILRAGLIAATTREAAEKVLAPKVYGTLILSELLKSKKIEPDFLVLFSSVSAITAPYAHCEYSAANAFLDAFASAADTRNELHTLTINWPVWKQVGRVAELETLRGVESWKEEVLKRAITTHDGLEAFRRALNSGLAQVTVSPELIEDLLRDSEAFDPNKYFASEETPAKEVARSNQSLADAPSNDIERTLTEIWSDVFGIDPIGVNDNFFDIGGHSLIAARIASRVERAFGKRLSMAAIFRAPTIAKLAASLQGVPAPHVIPFHARPFQRDSLLWLGGGPIFNPLAHHLDGQPSMVALTLPDESLAEFSLPYKLEDIATCMARKVQELVPEGPYFLGGWCLAGLLAYETARQLELQGRHGGLVVLVDTPLQLYPVNPSLSVTLARRLKRELFHLRRLWSMPHEQRINYIRGRYETLKVRLQYRRWKTAYSGTADARPQEQIFEEILFLAALTYVPSPFAGRMLFLQPQLRPADLYWNLAPDWKNLAEDFEVFEAPGDHTSMFFEPNAGILAERIRLAIRDTQEIERRRKTVSSVSIEFRRASSSS